VKPTTLLVACVLSCLVMSSAWATNGSFSHGVGQKAQGMGGAGIAFPQDSLAAGINPAGMARVGSRLDVGLTLFRPVRDAEHEGSVFEGMNGKFDGNDTKLFLIPEFGYNKVINERTSLGVSVFGNGGMNTDYDDGIRLFNGSSYPIRTGMNLMQLFIVPTLAWKLNDNHSFGIGLNLVAQALEVKGVTAFDSPLFSKYPGKVTNNDTDYSYGAGLRVGWLGKINEWLSLGATYQSRTHMSDFDDYKGMLAEGGSFDVPENYGVGIALAFTPEFTVALDVVQINFSDIDSMGNGGPITNPAWNPLGSSKGAGFGWDDQTVYKLGLAYQLNPRWMLRAGYNHGDAPIDKKETLFNILAPATVEDHVTLGATWTIDKESELTFHYMHAFENEIKGKGSTPSIGHPSFNLGEANIKMYQDSFGIGYSRKF
jgi:long-chain fatty acid transport protein